jgi:type II DNA modification protein
MPRKDKNVTPSVTQRLQDLGYNVSDWDDSKTETKLNALIIETLSKASKKQNGNEGYPDRIYFNKIEKLLILVEEKSNVKEHNIENIEKGTVSGIKWYLSFFANNKFKNYKILGFAVSGDILDSYNHKFDCFVIKNLKIENVPQITNFQTEENLLSIFSNFDEENAIKTVSSASKDINKLLRNIDSQKRPVLLSALMISLFKPKDYENTFAENYKTYKGDDILSNLYRTVKDILKKESIPNQKIEVLEAEINTMSNDQTLKKTNILKTILEILDEKVIPLFGIKSLNNSNYDIMGKFYEEFLRYAGITNVKKGIVLTPRHIATLFTKLIDIKYNDVILDLCCGTGAFLIAGMNKLISLIENSEISDKEEKIKNVKEKQLIGFEINPTMYICALSNMLFRGDGKSNIYNYDSINASEVENILNKLENKPTIGFINPPYSGKENKTNPTPKELTFLEKMLDNCSRYGIIIAPFSTYFGDDEKRENILKKHTLKYVINMPKDLFQPNAGTYTAIAVFETHKAHNYNENIAFYDLKDDGLVLTKNRGRTDIFNKWKEIEKRLLESLTTTKYDDNIISLKHKITKGSEWNIYAYSKTDYSNLTEKDFSKTIEDYLIFKMKKNMNILFEDVNEFDMLKITNDYFNGDDNEN